MKRIYCNCGRVVEHPHNGEEPEHCDRCKEDHELESGEHVSPNIQNEDDPRLTNR